MLPWHKLSKETQKTILALIVMSGGAATTRCCPPLICDPPPPPRTFTPLPPRSPVICDPAPPPSLTPARARTPVICDPAPPPRITLSRSPVICDPPPPPRTSTPATATPVSQRRFQLRGLQMTTDTTLKGAAVRGNVFDAQGQPLGEVKITVQSAGTIIDATTARNGVFFVRVPDPGSYTLVIGGDKNSAFPLQLKQFDVANVELVELAPPSPLPLAEIRSVDIVWHDDLTFQADSPWTGARYRWSASGGKLIEQADGVSWVPPTAPGRYLLQLVADWGADGLAVDALTLAVAADGTIVVC
ncbi:MAG: carboxypeptidase-like regulatory domain-containing protein [Chloroflexota bacterium]